MDTLPDVDPAALAAHFADPAAARQLVRGMIVMSLAVGPATPGQMKLVDNFAHALGVEEPAIRAIEQLAQQHKIRFMLDLHRRSNIRDYIDNQYKTQGGILAVAKGLLDFTGAAHDDALAARFRALGELPAGTLGRGFFEHYQSHGFTFPGEKGGFPVGALFHDFGHVIAGYDITPEGELSIASFQAGYRRTEDAFFTMLFAVLIHTAGVNVAPIPMPKHPGRIGEGDLAERMLHGLERGSQMTRRSRRQLGLLAVGRGAAGGGASAHERAAAEAGVPHGPRRIRSAHRQLVGPLPVRRGIPRPRGSAPNRHGPDASPTRNRLGV